MMTTTRIRIAPLVPDKLRRRLYSPPDYYTAPDDENNYWAEAIEDGDKFYYRVNGITIEITENEFSEVVINPSLYYFSTALKLHLRVQRAKITIQRGSNSAGVTIPTPP